MSIFPTRILLATDGSEEAHLAATTAAELASRTGSELHVVHVGELQPTFLAQTELEPAHLEREARELLDEQVIPFLYISGGYAIYGCWRAGTLAGGSQDGPSVEGELGRERRRVIRALQG